MSLLDIQQGRARAERSDLMVRAVLLEQWLHGWHQQQPVLLGQKAPEWMKIHSAREANEATRELNEIYNTLERKGTVVLLAA